MILNAEQKIFLETILVTRMLERFSVNNEFYDFNEGYDVLILKHDGDYWPSLNIIEKIESVLEKKKYDESEKILLNAVREYYLNRDKII